MELVTPQGKVQLPARIAPGSYPVYATFPEREPRLIGDLEVVEGGNPVVTCFPRMFQCRFE